MSSQPGRQGLSGYPANLLLSGKRVLVGHLSMSRVARVRERGETDGFLEVLVDTGLTSSLSESRRAISQGGVYLNNVKVTEEDARLNGAFLPSGMAVIRRGKKTLAGLFRG